MSWRVAPRVGWLGLWLALAVPWTASAQDVRLQIARGPYYVGTPVAVTVVAEGFDFDPEPTSEVDPPASGALTLTGMTPNTSTSVVMINGQVQRSSTVQFVYRYEFVASEPGRVEIGPFRVRQVGTERSSVPYVLEVRDVPRSDRLQVELRLQSDTTYVGARLPVTLTYRIEKRLQQDMVRSLLQVPALGMRDAFRIEPAEAGERKVEIATPAGPLELPATVSEERRGDREWLIVQMPYTMIPLRPGRFTLDPSSITLDAGIRFRNDFFDRRIATQIEKVRALDAPRALEVRPVPREGRPPSFAGAVGRGFRLDVTADRSVVQVGDPIELTLRLRGDGPLETASLPDLRALLAEQDFSVPDGELAGQLDQEAKTFSAVVRAKREQVTEIPALAYSYFDPETERFETIRSAPIALSVRPARMVDATQVVVPGGGEPEAPPDEASANERRPTGRSEEIDTRGLDLSIVREPERLLRGASGSGGWVLGCTYALGGLILLGAWLDRRRRSVDPEQARRRASVQEHVARAESAARTGDLAALRELASALRALRALAPGSQSAEIERYLAECDERIFAPRSDPGSSDETRALAERGRVFVQQLARELL